MGFLEIGFAVFYLKPYPLTHAHLALLIFLEFDNFVLVRVSTAARKKHHDQSNCVPPKDAPTGTPTGQEPRGQESREGCSLLACSSCLAMPAFL